MAGLGTSGLGRTQATEAVGRQNQAGGAKETSPTGSDEVRLSSLAEQVKVFRSRLDETGEGSAAREARLNELAGLVASQQYEPNADAVAGEMIEGMSLTQS